MKSAQSLWILPILAALILFPGCGKGKGSAGPQGVPVTASEAALQNLRESLRFVGDVKARDEAALYSKVTGKLARYAVEEGARVAKDDVVAEVDRDEVGFKYQQAPVKSTLAGVVGRTYLDQGADVRLDTPVALVVDMDEMRVRVSVPERHVPRVQNGQAALISVDAWPGEVFQGRVTKASPVIDRETRTAPIEISIPNAEGKLRPGMFARVELIVDVHEHAVVILEQAVAYRAGEAFVYVIENGTAVERKVRLGIRRPGKVEVTEGLQLGDIVVTAGHQKISNGAAVYAKETETVPEEGAETA